MSVLVRDHPPAVDRPVPEVDRRLSRLDWVAVICGACIALLVGLEGSPGWRVARVLVVVGLTTLLVAVQVRAPNRGRGWLYTAAAVPALVVAVGFLPHVVDGGAALVQAACLVLTASSVGLLVGGLVLVTRDRGPIRRVVTVVGVVAAAAVALLVAGPAVAVTNTPRPELGASPSSVGLVYEEVALHTDDGVALAAWYVPSSNGATVVLLHGAGSTRSDVLDEAALLARAGFGVLMVDARGHGTSDGRAMDFGWYGDSDIAAATAFLADRPDVDPGRIGAVGMSMGGEQALGAVGSNELIRAVVAEGATARAAADHAWLSDVYGFRGLVQEQLEHVQDWLTDPLTSASAPPSMRSAVGAATGTRVLLITAENVPDEGHAADYIAAAAPDRVEIWTVPGAGHTEGLQRAPAEWTERVVGFLTESLAPPDHP